MLDEGANDSVLPPTRRAFTQGNPIRFLLESRAFSFITATLLKLMIHDHLCIGWVGGWFLSTTARIMKANDIEDRMGAMGY